MIEIYTETGNISAYEYVSDKLIDKKPLVLKINDYNVFYTLEFSNIHVWFYTSFQDEDNIMYIPELKDIFYYDKRDLRKRLVNAYNWSKLRYDISYIKKYTIIKIVNVNYSFSVANLYPKYFSLIMFDSLQHILYFINKKRILAIYNIKEINNNLIVLNN